MAAKKTLESGSFRQLRVDPTTGKLYDVDTGENTGIAIQEILGLLAGFKGEKGDKGDRGLQGIPGTNGLRGEQGIRGEKGEIGETGERGEQGPIGIQGVQGVIGETGERGLQGFQGPQGQQGITGEQGLRGLQGDQGLQGVQGIAGNNGATGATGSTGSTGISAYQNAVNLGFVGTEQEWLDSLIPTEMPAQNVIYGGSYATVRDALDALFYTAVSISAFTSTVSEAELGDTVVGTTLNWTINKTVTSQDIDNGVPPINAVVRTYNVTDSMTTNQTWVLLVGDGQTTANRSTTLTFKQKRYWGVSTLDTLTDAQIRGLSGSEFATTRAKSITYNATGGRWIFYCYPAAFGSPSNVTVGGLAFSDYTVDTRAFENAVGYSSSYHIIRFNNLQTGSSIQVVWS